MFIPSSLQVFPHPRQDVFGFSRGRVFRADPTLVAEPVDEIEQAREIDLSGSGLVTAGSVGDLHMPDPREIDRKSTRLNSSHVAISYAVFCLKKKKKLCGEGTDLKQNIIRHMTLKTEL